MSTRISNLYGRRFFVDAAPRARMIEIISLLEPDHNLKLRVVGAHRLEVEIRETVPYYAVVLQFNAIQKQLAEPTYVWSQFIETLDVDTL